MFKQGDIVKPNPMLSNSKFSFDFRGIVRYTTSDTVCVKITYGIYGGRKAFKYETGDSVHISKQKVIVHSILPKLNMKFKIWF